MRTTVMMIVVLIALMIKCLVLVESIKISHVSVLLPYHGKGMELVASGISKDRCVQWSTDNDAFISLRTASCSPIATIIPTNQIPPTKDTRRSSMITATVLGTNEKVKCEVFVAELKNITMLTTMKRLVVGELETLRVQGRDNEENVFTSLNGINFSWKKENNIISLLDKADPSIHLEHLDQEDMWGAIVAKGLQVGKINIQVHIDASTPYYNSQLPQLEHTVEFNVLDNIDIHPKGRRFVPNSEIQFSAFRSINGDKIEEITTNSKYAWRICKECNPAVGTISSTGVFYAKSAGRTDVEIYQKGFEYNSAHATITVVPAKALKLKVELSPNSLTLSKEIVALQQQQQQQFDSHNLIVNRKYNGTWFLIDENGEELYWPKNFKVNWYHSRDSNQHLIKPIVLNDNSNQFIEFETTKTGKLIIDASLSADKSISTSEIFTVYEQVKHTDSLVIPPHQNEPLLPAGGCGKYNVFLLNQSGDRHQQPQQLRIDVNSLTVYGAIPFNTSSVYVCDSFNIQNGQFFNIEIAETGLVFVKNVGDVLLNREQCVTVEMLTKGGRHYTSFRHHLDFHEKTDFFADGNYYPDKQMKCFRGIRKGIAEIVVSEKNSNLYQLFHLSVYEQLKFSDDQTTSVLTLGMTQQLNIQEGPVQWDRVGVFSHIDTDFKISDPSLLKLTTDNKKDTFTIQCIHTGTQLITVDTKHTIPIQDSTTTSLSLTRRVECHHPSETELLINDQLTPQVYSRTGDILNVKLLVFLYNDNRNRLQIQSPKDLFHFKFSFNDKCAELIRQDGNEAQLRILESECEFVLRGEIAGYKVPKSLSKEYSYLDDKHIGSSATIRVANKISIEPKSFLLYQYTPVTTGIMFRASGGSGSYQFTINSTSHSAVQLKQDNSIAHLNVLDASLNQLHFVSVFVNDPYFEDSDVSNGLITQIGYITIRGENYLEQEESTILTLEVFDKFGNSFPHDQLQYMDLQLLQQHMTSKSGQGHDVVSIKKQTHDTFKVTGTSVGKIHLVATSKCHKQSPIHSLTVYPSLKISPSHVRLLVGAVYGLSVEGGVDHMNKRLVINNSDQQILKLQGDRKTVVKCLSVGTGQVSVGKVSAVVECVDMIGVRLPEQLTIFSGNEIYVSPVAVIATAQQQELELTHMQSDVLSLSYSLGDSKVITVSNNNKMIVSTMIKALKTGTTTITLTAVYKNKQTFTSTSTVHVYDKMFILDYPQRELIVPPNGQYQLKTNVGDHARFSVQNAELATISHNGKLMTRSTTGYSSVKVESAHAQVKMQKFSIEIAHYLNTNSSSASQLVAKNKYGEDFATISGLSVSVTSNDANIDSSVDVDQSSIALVTGNSDQSSVCIKIVSDNSVPFYFITDVNNRQQQQLQNEPQIIVKEQAYLHPGDIMKMKRRVQSIDNSRYLKLHPDMMTIDALNTDNYGMTAVLLDNNQLLNVKVARVNSIELENNSIKAQPRKPIRMRFTLLDSYMNEIQFNANTKTSNYQITRKAQFLPRCEPSHLFSSVRVIDSNTIELTPSSSLDYHSFLVIFDFQNALTGSNLYSISSNPIQLTMGGAIQGDIPVPPTTETKSGSTSIIVLLVTILAGCLAWYVYVHGQTSSSSTSSSGSHTSSTPSPSRRLTNQQQQQQQQQQVQYRQPMRYDDEDDLYYKNREGLQHYPSSKFQPYSTSTSSTTKTLF